MGDGAASCHVEEDLGLLLLLFVDDPLADAQARSDITIVLAMYE